MGKYDRYKFRMQLNEEKNQYVYELDYLFEDGDDIDAIIPELRNRIVAEAADLKLNNVYNVTKP